MESYPQPLEAGPLKNAKSGRPSKGKQAPACDHCWELQIRCMFNQGTEESCTNCVGRRFLCTWTKMPKPALAVDKPYTEYLQDRVNLLETKLKEIFPGINPKRELDSLLGQGPASEMQTPLPQSSFQVNSSTNNPMGVTTSAQATSHSPSNRLFQTSPAVIGPTGSGTLSAGSHFIQKTRLADVKSEAPSVDIGPPHEEDAAAETTISTLEGELHYHGQSSYEVLLRDAELLRIAMTPGQPSFPPVQTYRRPEFWHPTTAELRMLNGNHWAAEEDLALELPPVDLMPELIDAFFAKSNDLYHMLHRPLFEKQMREGLHFREPSFLRVVMLVCAIGARWSNDPRVWEDKWPVPLSAGYKWFRQVKSWNKNFTYRSGLWDVQILLLTSMFLHGSSIIHGTWNVTGTGLRLLVDAGIHRKRSTVSIENELYKRCFWTILWLDRLGCFVMGRQSAIQDLDYDLDDALEVDDEYWSLEPNAPQPVQPQGVPSRLIMFNRLIALCRIMGRVLQTVLALDRTKKQIGLDGPQGAAWMMRDMNAHLNLWARATPTHLRLPHLNQYRTFPFLDQAVFMWSVYFYLVQVINRQFISKTSPLAATCLRICREAARTCARMLDAHILTPGSTPILGTFPVALSSAMVLVIDLIGDRQCDEHSGGDGSGAGADTGNNSHSLGGVKRAYTVEQKAEDIKRCMRVLKEGEKYFHVAGRLHDILREFENTWRPNSSSAAQSSQSASSSGRGGSSQQTASAAYNTRVKVENEDAADSTFDIAYSRPDATPATLQDNVLHDPRYTNLPLDNPEIPFSTEQDISTMKYCNDPSTFSFNLSQSNLTGHSIEAHNSSSRSKVYPCSNILDGSYPGLHLHQSSNGPTDQYYSLTSEFQPLVPGFKHPLDDLAAFERGIYPSSMPGYDPPHTNLLINHNPAFAVTPRSSIFPPGGWILELNGARSNRDQAFGGGMVVPPGGANEKPAKPPMLAEWDAMVQYAQSGQKYY